MAERTMLLCLALTNGWPVLSVLHDLNGVIAGSSSPTHIPLYHKYLLFMFVVCIDGFAGARGKLSKSTISLSPLSHSPPELPPPVPHPNMSLVPHPLPPHDPRLPPTLPAPLPAPSAHAILPFHPPLPTSEHHPIPSCKPRTPSPFPTGPGNRSAESGFEFP